MTVSSFAYWAAPDRGGRVSPGAAVWALSASKSSPTTRDFAAEWPNRTAFPCRIALRFTKSKRLAATLPQMTIGLLNNGPTLHEVTL